jgi:hypothetical protein
LKEILINHYYSVLRFLLCLDDNIPDDEGLDEVRVDDLFILANFAGKVDQRLFRVDDYIDDSPIEMATHVFRADLLKLSLSVIEVDLYLALDEEISTFFNYPLAEGVADAHAEVDEIGYMREGVPLKRGCPLGFAILTAILRFLSL